MFSLDFIEKQIDFQLAYGIRDFEITGGEPGEFTDLLKAIQMIKTKSPGSKVAVITNGTAALRDDIVDAVDEVLLSYHLGRKSIGFDKDMFPLGTTWHRASNAVQNVKKHNKMLRTNTVLGTFNLDCVGSILDDLVQFQPQIINFLPVNLFDDAANGIGKFIDYSKLRDILKKAIDRLESQLPSAIVFIRYMPFCCMAGYEQHIVGHLQHIYDWFDWNVELDGISFLDWLDDPARALEKLGEYGSTSIDAALLNRRTLYSKSSACLGCRYNQICDGIENGTSLNCTHPSSGKMILNPLEFIKQTTYDKYNDYYE